MKLQRSTKTNRGLMPIEVIIVVFIVVVIVAIVLPTLSPHGRRSSKIGCVNNLKQIGLAYKIWAGDNNDKYPMELSITNGGALEWLNTTDAWKTFQLMSNELSTPKILYCPSDSARRQAATDFDDGMKTRISYFIGADATDTNPAAFLSGDDNLTINGVHPKPGLMNVSANAALGWDDTRHNDTTRQSWFTKTRAGGGNIGLTDGSVQSVNQPGLTNLLRQTGLATNHFVLP
ncbi:MAG: hypothetical protein RL616_2693 [Verrucomicrobiota bacterium]|jgi:competence protein ComGC